MSTPLAKVATILKKISFDDDRNNTLSLLLDTLPDRLSIDHVQTILKAFSFDDGKHDALKLLEPKMQPMDANDIAMLLKSFSFGDGKHTALKIIRNKFIVDIDDIRKILKCFSFDHERNKVLQFLVQGIPTVTVDQIMNLMEAYSFKSDFFKAVVNILQNKIDVGSKKSQDFEFLNTLHEEANNLNQFKQVAPLLYKDQSEIDTFKPRDKILLVNDKEIQVQPGSTIRIGRITITKNNDGNFNFEYEDNGNLSMSSGLRKGTIHMDGIKIVVK